MSISHGSAVPLCDIPERRSAPVSRTRELRTGLKPLSRLSVEVNGRDRIAAVVEWVMCALRRPHILFSSVPDRPVRWEHDGNGTRCQ